MLRKFTTTATILALACGLGTAQAQSLRNADQPAEFPPTSFTGKQYVDSKGCVFVRAGFDGAVTWVPRVSRKRQLLCGFTPSLAGASKPEMADASPDPKPVPRVAVADPKPEPVQTRPAVKPLPRTTAAAAPAPKPVPRMTNTQPARTAPVKPAPEQRVVKIQPAATAAVRTSCPGFSEMSQEYMYNSTHKIRCGPQNSSPTEGAIYGNAPANKGTVPAGSERINTAPVFTPPQGYRTAFTDDRLNPNRGHVTADGFAQMRLVWTAGVPRRLIDQNTGRDMTRVFPGLRFPFINMDQQKKYVTADGFAPMRLVWTDGVPRRLVDQNTGRDMTRVFPGLRFPFINMDQQKKYVAANGWPMANAAANTVSRTNVVVSSKNTPAAPVPVQRTAVPAGHRYVQVGTFGVPANADHSAARLQAMGLPVRIGNYQSKGKTLRIVMVGPFADAGGLQAGLNATRRAGFPDAFTRK